MPHLPSPCLPALRHALMLALLAASPVVLAQVPSSSVTGRVRNAQTGAYLEGAEVAVVGAPVSVFTLRDGRFTLDRVPDGAQRLRITYAGLDPQEIAVPPGTAGRRDLDIALTTELYRMDAFTVTSQREGEAVAIAKQRAAANVMNVVSMEGNENVADGNLGNFLQLLPGVAASSQAGDIIGVGLRGIPAELSGVTMDGNRMAGAIVGFSPLGDRAAQIDQISPDFIKEVRLSKANTPDMESGSLGGGIDLVTKSALDFRNRVATYRAGLTYNSWRDGLARMGPSFGGTFLDRFGRDRQWGVTLSASYTRTIVPRETMETARRNATNESFTGLRMVDDLNDRIRTGFGVKLERSVSASLRLFANVQYNYYTFDNVRHDRSAGAGAGGQNVADYNVVSRAAIEAGATPRTTANAVAGLAPGRTDDTFEYLGARWQYRSAKEEKLSRQMKYAAGGEARVLGGKLDFQASFNPTSFNNNYMGIIAFRTGGVGLLVDAKANRERPLLRQTYGPTVFFGTNMNDWATDQVYEQPDRADEYVTALNTNFERAFNALRLPLTLKAGASFRRQHQYKDNRWRPIWDYVGADGVAGTNPATGRNDDNLGQFVVAQPGYAIFNNHFPRPNVISWDAVRAYRRANESLFRPRTTSVSVHLPARSASEEVTSGYLMGTTRAGTVTLLGGVRYELTEVDGIGSNSDPLAPTQLMVRRKGDYVKYYPSAHLRYEPLRNLVTRASWSTTSARPQISAIVPNTTVTYGTGTSGLGTVNQNKPGLRPQYATNYDLAAEYYFEPAGVVSAGWFRKDVKDFINTARDFVGTGTSNGFGGNYAGFDFVTQSNLGSAEIEGYEFNYTQRFRFLPEPFKGLSLSGNYTYVKTQGTYSGGVSELAGFVPKTYNVGLSYTWRRVTVRTNYNFKSAHLNRTGAAAVNYDYIDKITSTDINVQFRYRPWATFYVDAVNIFNNAPNWYTLKNPARVGTVEVYGIRFSAGVSGRF